METVRYERTESGRVLPFVAWIPRRPSLAVSSATLGGGLGPCDWVLNATVPHDYDRADPGDHLAELARDAGLGGRGVGLMTAVDVDTVAVGHDAGVQVWATVGIDDPTWAAADPPGWHVADDARRPAPVGTINVVVAVPVRLADGALVNAALTATEAKVQALVGLGFAGTGTPTDAVCVVCPADGPAEPYGGPRSVWGARVARAVHAAMVTRHHGARTRSGR